MCAVHPDRTLGYRVTTMRIRAHLRRRGRVRAVHDGERRRLDRAAARSARDRLPRIAVSDHIEVDAIGLDPVRLLLAQRAELEKQIEATQKQERGEAIAKVKSLMAEYGLTITDLNARTASKPSSAAF